MPRYVTWKTGKKSSKTRQGRKSSKKYRRPTRPTKKYGGRMSKRKILDMTSKKHRDTMLCYSNTIAGTPNGGTTYNVTDATLTGDQFYIFPWVATARVGVKYSGSSAYPVEVATRQSTTCYMRGLKEHIEIQTNTGLAWQWRRICFTMKGSRINQNDRNGLRFSLQTSAGMVRVVNSIVGDSSLGDFSTLLFKGDQGKDWNNFITAPTDNSRLTIKYDKTITIQTGNSSGIMRKYKFWHPMNKNLVFDDDESGDIETLSRYSTVAKSGMGDYYVVDIITPGFGGAASDRLIFGPSATLYWSEK